MDWPEALKETLAGLSSARVARQLDAIMPEIDRRVREGVGHAEIVAALNANGFSLTLNTFRSCLYRYRRKIARAVAQGGTVVPLRQAQELPRKTKEKLEPGPFVAPPATGSRSELDEVLDRARRNEIGDEYLGRHRSLLKSKKKPEEEEEERRGPLGEKEA